MAGPFSQRLQSAVRSTLGLPALAAEGPPQEDGDDLSKSLRIKYRPRSQENADDRSSVRLLPADEIVRELRRFRYDPEFRGARRVPISCLASLCGIDRRTIYTAMMGQEVSHAVKAKLSWAIVEIREGAFLSSGSAMGVRIPETSPSLAAAAAEPRPRWVQRVVAVPGLRKLEVVAGLDEWLALASVP